MAVIDIKNIARHFTVGNEVIKALKTIDLSIEKNEFVVGFLDAGEYIKLNWKRF